MLHFIKHNLTIMTMMIMTVLGTMGIYWQTSVADNGTDGVGGRQIKTESIVVGMGCFWGAEKRMSALPGVVDVVSGYAGGSYPDPTYRKLLASKNDPSKVNHAEVIKVSFDPAQTSVEQVLVGFWENHNPTQGDRQGNDVGSNYRSAIYYNSDAQKGSALMTRDAYQKELTKADFGEITTEIAALDTFYPAEEYHQDYLNKNPNGYCGIGGTQVKFPSGMSSDDASAQMFKPLDSAKLSRKEQLVVFESEHCAFCKLFKQQVLDDWKAEVPVSVSMSPLPPKGWELMKDVWATPTIVLFRDGKEVSRYTGYNGEKQNFWGWLGQNILDSEAIDIAYRKGTERPFTGSMLDNNGKGTYVDPVTGEPLFRSDSKFESGTGWPSFFQPIEGAITMHDDHEQGMNRVEVRSASSGIHLGHVFNDGPPPSGKRYCINGKVLRFVADKTE